MQTAHGVSPGSEPLDDIARAVGRIIVDDDDFTVKFIGLENIVEHDDEPLDSTGFFICRDDDREFELRRGSSRRHGHVSGCTVGKRAGSNVDSVA